jgi:hypothetical protein
VVQRAVPAPERVQGSKHDQDTLETGARPGGNFVSEDTLLDQLDFCGLTQEEVLGQSGLVNQLTGRVFQKILEGELTAETSLPPHPGYDKNSSAGDNSGDRSPGTLSSLHGVWSPLTDLPAGRL